MKINVLGTKYTVECRDREADKCLKDIDGYCDKTSRLIVVVNKDEESNLDNFKLYQDKCLRHEIIHAFLFESGLQENFEHKPFGHNETYVDWFAVQFPKILKVYQELDIL